VSVPECGVFTAGSLCSRVVFTASNKVVILVYSKAYTYIVRGFFLRITVSFDDLRVQ